jgi:antirestriction protein ArdC/DNA polymerase III epsilon subunit-like protein
MIEAANEFTTNTRRVNRRSAFRVVSRSLHSSEGLPFSVRKHQALTELSNYIALAKHNKVVGLTAFNTDLLPLTHPRSTREHSMTASAMIRTHVQWVIDDPRITNEDAKALIASAMLAPANSPEKLYAITRLENLPQGHVPLDALTAAYGGGNSAAAKRARVALQLRDRIGRWVEMFGGLGIKVKRRDGSTSSLTGRAIGQNIFSPQLADVELGDGRIVAMPIRQARGGNFLASDEAKKDGFTRAGSTADDIDDPIIDEADLTFMESPSSFDKDEKGSKQGTTKYTDQAYDVVKFDDNKRALTDLTETNKRRAEQDLDDAAVDKQGETDAESGKQFWDPEKPIYAVSRRGGTPFAYTQNWSDAQQRIQTDQRFLDEEEGRTPLARIAQDDNTLEDETPLVDQQDKFKKEEIARLSEPEAPAGASPEFKYKVPEDTYEITNPTAPYRSVSEYDDPASLANMFQGDELVEGLDDALDTGLGRLTFPDGTDSDGEPTGGEQEVPAEAILKAIDEKGGDAELALAQAYDKRLGTNENEDALSAQREADKEGKIGEPKKLGEVFDEVTKAPEPEAPAEEETPIAEIPEITEDAEPSKLPALLDGLTEEEKADFQKNGDYTPYLPKDGPVEWPEGSTPPQDRILSEEERKQALELANSELSDDDLIESYNGAVKNLFDENGSAPFGIEDENNEVQTVQIPSEVLRDAIKLRDYSMDEVNGAVLNGAYDPVEEKAPIKFKKNKETGRMESDLGDNTVVTYGKDESGNWSADATRYSPDGGVDAEESYPAKNKAEARQLAEDVINSYNETQDIIDPADLPEQPDTEEEEPVAEIPTPETPAEGKGSKLGKDPLKEGWTADEWLTSVSKDERFHEMLTKNKDFTRLAAFFNDPTFNSPLLSDYQDKEMEGFESGDEVSAIDMGEYGFEPGPSGRVQYALDLLQDPTMSIRGGFKDWKTGERSNENVRNILKAADDQLGLAKEDLDETDVIENKAIDSVRATLAKEIAKLDKQIEKDNKKAEEDAIAPQVSYKLTGDRLDLRSGKKAPFRVQEVKDFLDDNGFDWNPDAKAETKSGMDEASAKKFLRDLRDKFGIDLLPREGQPPIDLDSKDEVIEAPATPEAPSVKPKEKSLKEREDEEFSKFLPLPETLPEGWEKDEERGYNEVYYQRSVENENGDRISGTYSKDGSREPYWTVSADFESTESFKSFEDALDFYNKNSGKEEITPEAPEVSPEETKPTEEVKEPKVKIKEATFDPENPASQEYAKETLKQLVEDRKIVNEAIKNAEANGLTPEEFDALVEMRDEMNEKIDQIVNEVPTDALTSDNDISRAKKEKDEEPEDQDTKEDPTSKKSKRELKKEAKRRKELILKMIFTEFGPGALELDNPDRSTIKAFTDILDSLTTEELEEIGRRLNEELGWNFFRSKKGPSKPGDVTVESEGTPSDQTKPEADIVDAEVVPDSPEVKEDPTTTESEQTPSATNESDIEDAVVVTNPRIATAKTTDLKPGDVMTKDFFTVTNVEEGFEKKRNGEMVPASRVTGYYPGGVEQSSKLWADDVLFDIYRDVTPPAKGDLPELNQPKMGDYGKLTKINGEWELKDPAEQKQFEQDMEKYQEQLSTQKALWNAPEVEPTVKEFTPENTLHVVNALGKDLKPNDIAFRRDENGELSEFFVIEEVLPGTVMVPRADGKPAEEKVQIRGYYPGHESQVKSWKTGTSVEVLRGEQAANIPAKGDKPAIDSIEPGTLKGQAYKDKNAEIAALRKEAGKAYTPDLTASEIPAVLVEKPNSFSRGNRPAFFGKAAELANLKDGKAISDALKGKRVVYFDFETVGTGKFDNDNPDAPIQVAASVWEGGEKVGEINLFINPGESLGDYYYKTDEDGNRVLDPEKLLSFDGQTVDDAFLATQPSIEDQLRAFAEFAGQDAIFVAHNAEFDTNTFEKWAKKFGIDYNMDGVIDTLELAKSMTPKGNKLGQVAKRYGIEKTDEEWHDARTDSEVLPAILEGLLGDMKPDNREFDPATRLAEFEAKRSSYNEKLEAFKKQEAELAMAEAVKRGMSGEQVSVDEMLGKTKTTSGFGSEGSTDSAEEYAYESIFGGKINDTWIEDDENTFVVDEGGATVGDIKIGDFVPAEGGGYHEVVDLLADPEDPNGTIVVRKIVSTGELYSTRVTEKKSPGIGWSNGKVLKGTLRRRNELAGKTPAEVKALASKPVVVAPEPKTKDKTPTPKGKKSITPEETQSVVSDAIETITSGAKSDATVEEAVKGLPLDDTVKSVVLADRPDASINHLSADGVALKVGDRVRGTKHGRMGEVRAILTTYGPRGYKNYVKVKFDDAEKRENISAGSLQIINPDDGGGFFTDPTPPATGEPVNPNVGPKSEEELSSLLDGQAPEDTPSVEIPEEPVVTDREARIAQHKLDEERRMERALELNYRQVSPDALQALTAAVGDNAEFDKGYKATVTGFMPNLSTGEPLDTSFTFIKPSAKDVMYYDLYEPDDILVRTGPSSLAAIIKSDGKILYFDYPAAPNWKFSVYSLDINNAIENPNAIKIPLGENPNLQKMGMISLDQEFPEDATGSPDDGPDPDFVADSPDAEPKGIKPTKQQQAVIDAVVAGKDVIVQALAGTGKTSTLKMAAKAVAEKDPDKTILYIAFNKAVAAELNADPDKPSNMVARTNTQVAWHHSPTWMQKRSFDKTSIGLPTEVADHLEIGPVKVVEIKKDGTKVEANLSSREVVAVVRQAVTAFAQSADEKIMPQHFTDNFVDIPEVFIDYANRWWDDISSPKGRLSMNQSFPEKYVQLNGIDVTMSPDSESTSPDKVIPAADIIFFDEAQDINDVAGDWVRKQNVQKVFVGDGNQSIYGFRGAKDQLDTLEGAEKLQINESFRFGPNIAAPANRFLAVAGKPEKVIGAGKDQGKVVESLDEMPDPDAVLVRTNGGGFKAMLEYLEQGKIVGISQSTKTRLEEVIDTTSWLMGGKKGSKPAKYNAEIGMYDSWEELSTAVREGKARPVKAFYDLVTQNGMQSIREILDRVVVEREETAESKIALKNYKPLTLDKVEDGSTGKLDSSVTYTIEGDDVVLTGFFKYNNEKLKEAGFKARKDADGNWAKDRRITIEDDLKKVDKLNQLKKILEGVIEPVKADVVITTAHQSKGLQWDKVRIYDDFWGPKFNKETGEIDMPAPEELRLAYVAITRAQKEVYLGPLSWVNDYTSEEDEQAIAPSFTLQAMSDIKTDPVPVTPEEFDNEVQETAKKIDPATQKIADAIIEALENGTAPWRKPWTGGGFLPTSIATGKMYEGTNVLVLWAAQERNGWSDNRWLTYKQAEKLGGNIKRGEKATSIIHWTPKFKDVKQPDGTTEKVFVYTPPKIINVFNVEQAEGINLPPLVKGEPVPVSQGEQTLLDTYKDRPEIFYKSQDSAYYSPVTDTIHLPLREQFGAEQDIFETIVHELAHSTGHTSRVNRKDLTDNYGTHKASRGEEELIAEISVALVAARLGVEIDFGNVASYAKSWLGALKNDPQMIIKAAKQAQKAVDHMLGKQEEPAKVDEEGNPVEPVGEGVGSEGKTGDEIAEDAGLKPETTPEANVGEEGTTGEELTATAKTPKNIDPNITAEKIKYGSKMHTVWNDVTYDPERKSDWRIEGGSGVMFKRIMENQEVISDEAEVGKYITDMLVKYGYGDRVFNLSMANSDKFFAENPEHNDVEAAVSRGTTESLPDSHPFKDKDLPVVLVRSRGTTKVALLHEIAHLMEANWKNPNGDGGHNSVWYATWVALLRSEGFTKQANILEMAIGKLDEGDTGVINP